MAFEAKIFEFQAVGDGTSTISVDATGFGTPEAALIYMSGTDADNFLGNTPNYLTSQGFALPDGTQGGVHGWAQNGSASNYRRWMHNTRVAADSTSTDYRGYLYTDANSFQNDEFRMYEGSNLGPLEWPYRGYVILMKGAVNYKIGRERYLGGTTPWDYTGIGFNPTILFGQTTTANTTGSSSGCSASYGVAIPADVARTTVEQCMWGRYQVGQGGISVGNHLRGPGDPLFVAAMQGTTSIHRGLIIDSWIENGCRFVATGSTGSNIDFDYLAIELPTDQHVATGWYDVVNPGDINQTITYPTGSANDTELLGLFHSQDNVWTGSLNHDNFGFGHCDKDLTQKCCSFTHQPESSQNRRSYFDPGKITNYQRHDGLFMHQATITAITDPGFTINYSATTGQASRVWWWAIQKGDTAPQPTYPASKILSSRMIRGVK